MVTMYPACTPYEIPKSRVARSSVILDAEDIRILLVLNNNKPEMFLRELESILKISRKSILVHIKRLNKFHWISYLRSTEDYKSKVIGISPLGIKQLDILEKSGVRFVCKVKEKQKW